MKCVFGHDWLITKTASKDYYDKSFILVQVSKDEFYAAPDYFPKKFIGKDIDYSYIPGIHEQIYFLKYASKEFDGVCRKCKKLHLGYTQAIEDARELVNKAMRMAERDKKLADYVNIKAEMRSRK